MIVPGPTSDGFPAGPIAGWWPHGFNLRQLALATGAYVPLHARREVEVLFVQEGTVEVSWAGGALILGAGDTLSVPVGLPHAFRNTASGEARIFVVIGGDDPSRPVFSSASAASDRAGMAAPDAELAGEVGAQ